MFRTLFGFGRKHRLTQHRVPAPKTDTAHKSSRRTVHLALEQLESRTVPTILFEPVGRGPEVFAFNGATMSQSEPLASNPYALNSPKVYFIFVGPNWQQSGLPTAAVACFHDGVRAAGHALLPSGAGGSKGSSRRW